MTPTSRALYYRGFLLEAQTFNNVKGLVIRDADTNATHSFSGGPGANQIQHNGQTVLPYFFTTPFLAHLCRFEPTDSVEWQYFKLTWVTDDWPELTQTRTPFMPVLPGGSAAFLQGAIIPLEAAGNLPSLVLNYDNGQTVALTSPITPVANTKVPVPFSLATPVVCHEVQLVPSNPVRIWTDEIQWIAQPTPDLAFTWTTQFTAHGLKGFHHLARIKVSYAASASVTFTVTSFDGTSPAVLTLPSTGGVEQKVDFTFTFNKGQLYRYSAVSTSTFQIFLQDTVVFVGEWGRTGQYLPYRLIGAPSGEQARI